MIVIVKDGSGNMFNINHPSVKDIKTAKDFLVNNHPFFDNKTNWNEYNFTIKND